MGEGVKLGCRGFKKCFCVKDLWVYRRLGGKSRKYFYDKSMGVEVNLGLGFRKAV